MKHLFTEHPASVGETYWQHLWSATGFSARMLIAALCCLIHGLLPFLFTKTGSETVAGLHDRMIVNRSRLSRTTRSRTTMSGSSGLAIDARTES